MSRLLLAGAAPLGVVSLRSTHAWVRYNRAVRFAAAALPLLLGIVGCDNGKMHLHPPDGHRVDTPPPPAWWQPAPGATRNWDIQVGAAVDLATPRAMYVLDLWALVPEETTLDYGDGDPVTVPAGALAGKLAELKARTPAPIVICRVGTGAIRLDDPDARKFPGYDGARPDRPEPMEPGSVIGWSTTADDPDERFLDTRASSRAAWTSLVWKRLDLAKQIGCDGVEGHRNEMAKHEPGFELTAQEQISWFSEVATQLHDRELSAGMQTRDIPEVVDSLSSEFDWMITYRCAEFDQCDQMRPFLNLGKAVFAVDYDTDADGEAQNTDLLCQRQQEAMIDEGLIKDAALSSAVRDACVE